MDEHLMKHGMISWSELMTSDVDATARNAAELGGKIVVPPKDIPQVGRFCVIQDPQGAFVSAITYVKPQG